MPEFSDGGTPDGLRPYDPAGDAEFTSHAFDSPDYEETEIIPVGEGYDGSPYQAPLAGTAEISDVPDEYSLAGWEQAEPLGKIEGSEWVNPTNGTQTLADVHQLGGRVTAEDVRVLADGRDQHLELFRLPEGYKYVRIVDSATGQALTGVDDDKKYSGHSSSCGCGTGHGIATTPSILDGRPVPIEGNKAITEIINLDEGTQTTVRPTAVGLHEPDYISRSRTLARFLPAAHELYINAETPVGAIDKANGKITIRQDDQKISGELLVCQNMSDGYTVGGQIGLTLNRAGQVETMQIYKSGLLRTLGVRPGSVFTGNKQATMSEWANVTDPAQQQQIAEALAEALGMDDWNGLDLRLTASGLYKTMGQRNFDFTSALVLRS
jgi:hypothetical protein